MFERLSREVTVVIAVSLALGVPSVSWAVDTVEAFDVGATDVDFYFGFEGVGLHRHERGLSGDLMLGYGLIEGFSAYLGTTFSADEYMSSAAGDVYLGVYGTPLDTDHFDMDLFLDFTLGGESFSEFQVGPALELNVDLDPDMESWGMFLNVGVPIYSRTIEDETGAESDEAVTHFDATLGTYVTVASGHQLLLDYTMSFYPNPEDGAGSVEVGSVGVGYNVAVHDAIELISEVRVDIPQEGESPSVGFVVGLIASMPSARTYEAGVADGRAMQLAELEEAQATAIATQPEPAAQPEQDPPESTDLAVVTTH